MKLGGGLMLHPKRNQLGSAANLDQRLLFSFLQHFSCWHKTTKPMSFYCNWMLNVGSIYGFKEELGISLEMHVFENASLHKFCLLVDFLKMSLNWFIQEVYRWSGVHIWYGCRSRGNCLWLTALFSLQVGERKGLLWSENKTEVDNFTEHYFLGEVWVVMYNHSSFV